MNADKSESHIIYTLNLQQGAVSGSDSIHGCTRIFGQYRQLQAPAPSNIDNGETLRQEISRDGSYAGINFDKPDLQDGVSKLSHSPSKLLYVK